MDVLKVLAASHILGLESLKHLRNSFALTLTNARYSCVTI